MCCTDAAAAARDAGTDHVDSAVPDVAHYGDPHSIASSGNGTALAAADGASATRAPHRSRSNIAASHKQTPAADGPMGAQLPPPPAPQAPPPSSYLSADESRYHHQQQSAASIHLPTIYERDVNVPSSPVPPPPAPLRNRYTSTNLMPDATFEPFGRPLQPVNAGASPPSSLLSQRQQVRGRNTPLLAPLQAPIGHSQSRANVYDSHRPITNEHAPLTTAVAATAAPEVRPLPPRPARN